MAAITTEASESSGTPAVANEGSASGGRSMARGQTTQPFKTRPSVSGLLVTSKLPADRVGGVFIATRPPA